MAHTPIANDEPLAFFMRDTARYGYLSLEQEQTFARRWRDQGDRKALDQLIGSHIRLVAKIARGYGGYGLPVEDLIAEGNVGLMQAAQKFDPERGFRFNTYAAWWVKAGIQEYILHNWSLVKLGTTASQKKLFFNLRRLKSRLQELETGDLSPESVAAIATELDVPEADVIAMNRRLSGVDSSLNVPTTGEEGDTQWMDLLVDDRTSHETEIAERNEISYRMNFLRQGLDVLNEREREILIDRRLRDVPLTLEALSQRYAVSRERVRQLENNAYNKVRKAVLAHLRAANEAEIDARHQFDHQYDHQCAA